MTVTWHWGLLDKNLGGHQRLGSMLCMPLNSRRETIDLPCQCNSDGLDHSFTRYM